MKKLREWVDAFRLKRLLLSQGKIKRKPVLKGLAELSSLAILYRADNTEAAEVVQHWANHLRKGGLAVRTLGYFHEKSIPENVQARLNSDFFCRRDVTSGGKPTGPVLQTFAAEPFDMLINLCDPSEWPVTALLANTSAHCRVGKQSAEEAVLYDLLFSVAEHVPLYKQTGVIEKYLGMIHTRHEKI